MKNRMKIRFDSNRFCLGAGYTALVILATLIIVWLTTPCVRAAEIDKAGMIPKDNVFIDGVYVDLEDGTVFSMDPYFNEARKDLHKWKDLKDISKYIKRIRTDANFCVLGIDGNTPKERREKLHIAYDNQKIFEKAFWFEAKEGGTEKRALIYDPNDYIWIIVRMIPDCGKLNVPFLLTFVSKTDAYKLGCRDQDVVNYVEKGRK